MRQASRPALPDRARPTTIALDSGSESDPLAPRAAPLRLCRSSTRVRLHGSPPEAPADSAEGERVYRLPPRSNPPGLAGLPPLLAARLEQPPARSPTNQPLTQSGPADVGHPQVPRLPRSVRLPGATSSIRRSLTLRRIPASHQPGSCKQLPLRSPPRRLGGRAAPVCASTASPTAAMPKRRTAQRGPTPGEQSPWART